VVPRQLQQVRVKGLGTPFQIFQLGIRRDLDRHATD
jgi:hypothetical protein